jgi:branched-chain amino acid transport system permease protein
VLGFLLARYRGIFFGLLSLALSMILYGLLVKSEALGSTDGFNILPSTLLGIRPGAEWVRYAVPRVVPRRAALRRRRCWSSLPRDAARPARAGDQGQRDPGRVHGRLGAPGRCT